MIIEVIVDVNWLYTLFCKSYCDMLLIQGSKVKVKVDWLVGLQSSFA